MKDLGNGMIEVINCWIDEDTGEACAAKMTMLWSDVSQISEYVCNSETDWKHLADKKKMLMITYDKPAAAIVLETYQDVQKAWMEFIAKGDVIPYKN